MNVGCATHFANAKKTMKLIPTILCGGSGSRLWPVSREQHPKPFIRLHDNQSLLQKAFIRGAALDGVAEILTVTNRELFFKTQDEYRAVNSPMLPLSYILEPFGRNTAPAVAAAAIQVAAAHGPDAILLVLAADHLIVDQAEFAKAVKQATTLAAAGRIVAFGIQPTAPETGCAETGTHHNMSSTTVAGHCPRATRMSRKVSECARRGGVPPTG